MKHDEKIQGYAIVNVAESKRRLYRLANELINIMAKHPGLITEAMNQLNPREKFWVSVEYSRIIKEIQTSK